MKTIRCNAVESGSDGASGIISLVINADKLMSVLKTITGTVSKVNSTAATINSVAGSYDGLMLGFDLKK